ncbi:hypothetical protein [Francisella orientalis]|nr:hypothetical protein [Francisella orientalis]AFJ44167.1 hypothetical protein OOM_1828 [Francisella orientalis str. Toba 04]AHB99032.1 hypothetical protein M973_00290 [Francisella orientalis LADL 07-285A]APD41971.1 hypothetical protein BMT43_09235 [Francisella orientalis]MBK2005008.1 hypothetical protein [Francisella orientalis]MBK2006648.1 hypothetical protein [Francisella orientalis]
MIGIFDSDNENIKLVSKENYNVYSFKIDPANISTELLFSDDEIKTVLDGKRLFIGSEFDSTSKYHLIENFHIGGKAHTKASNRIIIDKDIYKGNNIACISKECFAQAIYNGQIQISDASWENFRHIFEKISEIIDSNQVAGSENGK